MSPDAPVADAAPPESPPAPAHRTPARRMFTRHAARVAMPVEAATRQGRIAMLAWETLGDGEAARAFLNTHDDELGRRPIALATESAAGLKKVEAVLAARHGRTT